MTKIDLKDRKILYYLDLDCRQSNTQIGKKVGLKKDVVSYRIKKLEEEGVITQYWANINTFKLGYNVFRIYINFRNVTPEKKQEIIDYFVNYKNSWVVATIKSEINLDVVVWVKSIHEFYNYWGETLDKYEEYFDKFAISIYIQANVYRKSYLLPEQDDKNEREMYRMTCGGEPVKIDELEGEGLPSLMEVYDDSTGEDNRPQIVEVVDSVWPHPGSSITSVAAGLLKAKEILGEGSPIRKRFIILLSDGLENWPQYLTPIGSCACRLWL